MSWINHRKEPPDHGEAVDLDLGEDLPIKPARYFCNHIPTVPYYLIHNGTVKIWPDDVRYKRVLYHRKPERATTEEVAELMK